MLERGRRLCPCQRQIDNRGTALSHLSPPHSLLQPSLSQRSNPASCLPAFEFPSEGTESLRDR